MSSIELIRHLKALNNPERLMVIEAATRLIREDLTPPTANGSGAQDPILRVIGSLSGESSRAEDLDSIIYGEP